jgi:hypothetical protein
MTIFEITLQRHDGSFCTYDLSGSRKEAQDEVNELQQDGFYATFTGLNRPSRDSKGRITIGKGRRHTNATTTIKSHKDSDG